MPGETGSQLRDASLRKASSLGRGTIARRVAFREISQSPEVRRIVLVGTQEQLLGHVVVPEMLMRFGSNHVDSPGPVAARPSVGQVGHLKRVNVATAIEQPPKKRSTKFDEPSRNQMIGLAAVDSHRSGRPTMSE